MEQKEASAEQPEDFFEIVGSFGLWQKKVFAVIFYTSVVGTWPYFAMTFLAPKMNSWCVEPYQHPLRENRTRLLPFDINEQCYVQASNINSSVVSDVYDNITNHSVKCRKWEYETSDPSSTLVNEWNLVCDREWLISLADSVYMIGFLISAIFFGQLSDSIGRCPTLVISFTIAAISATLSIFSTSYLMFVIIRFFQAIGRTGLRIVGFVLILEMVGTEHRTSVGIACEQGFGVGMCILPALGYFFSHWYWFQVAIAVPLFPVAFGYMLVVPESPRWLLVKGKRKKLEQLLSDVMVKNKRPLKSSIKNLTFFTQSDHVENIRERKTILDLFKSPNMRRRTFILVYIWIVVAFLYWALSFHINDLNGNRYLNFFLSGFIDFPASGMVFLSIRQIGRRPTLVTLMICGGIASGAVLMVPEGLPWLITTFVMIWRCCVCGSFSLLYFYTSELFPTVVRSVAIGFCSTSARIGSILAPFVKELSEATHPSLTVGLYVVLSVSSGLLALSLPETRGRKLLSTLEEGERLGKITKFTKLPTQDVEMRVSC